MKRGTYWQITVEWWAHVPDGAEPLHLRSDVLLSSLPEADQARVVYTHDWDFAHPPSRADLIAAIMAVPWSAHAYGETIVPVLRDATRSQWPMIDWMHKGAHSNLVDEFGRVVGRLNVRRMDLYQNVAYVTAPVSITEIEAAVRGFRSEKRARAVEHVRDRSNAIRERIALLNAARGGSGNVDVACEIEYELARGGFYPSAKCKRVIAAYESYVKAFTDKAEAS